MRFWRIAAILAVFFCAGAVKAQEMDARFAVRGGISFTDSRTFTEAGAAAGRPNSNQEFSNVSGFTAQFQLGCVFNYTSVVRAKPFLEASYFAGSDAKLSGFSFDVGVRF